MSELKVLWTPQEPLPLAQVRTVFIDEFVSVSPRLQQQCDSFWQEKLAQNPRLFNGAVCNFKSFRYENGCLVITVNKTDYKTKLFSESRAIVDESLPHINPFAFDTVLVSSDDHVILGLRESHTYAGGLITTLPSGGVDVPAKEHAVLDSFYEEANTELGLIPENIAEARVLCLGSYAGETQVYLLAKTNLTHGEVSSRWSSAMSAAGSPEFVRLFTLPLNQVNVFVASRLREGSAERMYPESAALVNKALEELL